MEQTPAELAPKDAVRALESFVIDNPELADLEAVVGRFNVFDALRVVRAELAHSNFLAWLIDPSESHGLGQLFLRAVLMDILRKTDAKRRPMSPIDLDGLDMGGVAVRREWRSIDLLIVSTDPKVVIAIENKVDSGEHSDQLKRYRDTVRAAFPDHEPMFVFLTRGGDEPSEDDWAPYDYGRLHDAIRRTVATNETVIGDDVRTFLEHYLHTIRSHFMNDEEIDRLCETIYKQHRVALDLIFERRGDPRKQIALEFRDALLTEDDSWLVYVSGYGCQFMPKTWTDIVPPIAKYTKLGPHALVRGQFWVAPEYIELTYVVGPATDAAKRQTFLDVVASDGSRYGASVSGKKGQEWTRVRRKQIHRPSGGLFGESSRLDETIRKWAADANPTMTKLTSLMQLAFCTD